MLDGLFLEEEGNLYERISVFPFVELAAICQAYGAYDVFALWRGSLFGVCCSLTWPSVRPFGCGPVRRELASLGTRLLGVRVSAGCPNIGMGSLSQSALRGDECKREVRQPRNGIGP